MRICPVCGETNEDWMDICQRCGNSLNKEENALPYDYTITMVTMIIIVKMLVIMMDQILKRNHHTILI